MGTEPVFLLKTKRMAEEAAQCWSACLERALDCILNIPVSTTLLKSMLLCQHAWPLYLAEESGHRCPWNPLIDQTGGPMSPWDPPLSASPIAEGTGCAKMPIVCVWTCVNTCACGGACTHVRVCVEASLKLMAGAFSFSILFTEAKSCSFSLEPRASCYDRSC